MTYFPRKVLYTFVCLILHPYLIHCYYLSQCYEENLDLALQLELVAVETHNEKAVLSPKNVNLRDPRQVNNTATLGTRGKQRQNCSVWQDRVSTWLMNGQRKGTPLGMHLHWHCIFCLKGRKNWPREGSYISSPTAHGA